MLQFLIKNPLILNILNNTEKPSNLDGLSATLIQILTDKKVPQIKQTENMKLLMQIFKELIASEYMFCNSHNNDCFVFLRERSRIAARMTGDFTISLCQKLGFNWLNQWCSNFYKFGAKEEKNVKKITQETNDLLDKIFSQQFVNDIPIEIRYIVKLIFTLSDQFNFTEYKYMLTGNLLILRMICPFISVPEFYHIVPDDMGAPSGPARKCLTLVGKILSNLANNSFSVSANSQKFELDEQLLPYKNIIYSNGTRYRDWIDRIMKANFDQFQIQEQPKITPQPQPSQSQQQTQVDNTFEEGSSDSEGFVPVQLQEKVKQVQNIISMTNCTHNESDSQVLQSLKITEEMKPSEIIHMFLAKMFPLYDERIIKDNQLSLQGQNIKLRYLAALHNSIISQKHAIYDLIQSMTHHDHDYISWFEQAAQEEKFKRFIEVYDRYYSQPSERDQLIKYFNMLIIALEAAPPQLIEVDYRPFDKTKSICKIYNITFSLENINLKQSQGQLKITKCQVFILNGKQIKFQIQGNKINLIKIQKSNLLIGLSFQSEDQEFIYLEMLISDEQSWQQVISSLFEMCYNKSGVSSEQYELPDGSKAVISNDSVFTWSGSKITDEIYIIGMNVEKKGGEVSISGKDGKSMNLRIQSDKINDFITKVKKLKAIFGSE